MNQSEFNEKFSQLTALVKGTLDAAPGCHDFDHTARVLDNAIAIATAEPDANIIVVKLAALLHDIARPEEMTAKGACCHAAIGAAASLKLLQEYGFDAKISAAVAGCIRKHRYRDNRRPETIEEKIIYDADKLDSIGAIGIGRAFHFAGRENARLHNAEDVAMNSAAYSREDTAYREYLVKLRHIHGKMLTSAGRRMATARSQFMEEFFTRLNDEVKGLK